MIGYAIAAGFAGLVTAGYHTMAPRSQLYGRTFLGAPPPSWQLALTFDDGPNDPYTLKLLEVLARHEVQATFFVLGKFTAQRPDIVREIVGAGHVIGNHTYSHPNLIFSSAAQVEAQIRECERAIAEAVGEAVVSRQSSVASEKPETTAAQGNSENTRSFDSAAQNRGGLAQDDRGLVLFRPPHGGRRPGVLRTVRRLGYVPVMWSVSGWDWSAKSADEIEHTVVRQVRGGDVILLHDGGHERMGTDRSRTVTATDRIIKRYKNEGYEFVTVPELMKQTTETQSHRGK